MTFRSDQSAFTRTDLLALVAFIATTSVVAIPLQTRSNRKTSCVDNLRSISIASQMYALDNSGRLPGCQHSLPSWVEGLDGYCSRRAYICPETREPRAFTIALNDFLTPHPHGARKLDYSILGSIPCPSGTLLFAEATSPYSALKFDHFHFADAQENGFTVRRFREQVDVSLHRGSANYLFPDGHLETLRSEEAATRVTASSSKFVHPAGASGSEYLRKTEALIVSR